MAKQPAIICDIDGTISDYSKRKHWLAPLNGGNREQEIHGATGVNWEKFNQEAIHDAPIEEVIKIVRWAKNASNTKIILLTGRNDKYRRTTLDWLNLHRIPHDRLLMRKYGDWRADVEVKTELFLKNIVDAYEVLFALEDRDKVVEMWRNLGIRCLQVAKGEY